MWTCPKCGREFKKTNQDHYCGKAPETVDEYIALQTTQAQKHLTALRNLIRSCVPEVKEQIAWSMPFFEKRKSFHFHGSMQKAYQFLCGHGND